MNFSELNLRKEILRAVSEMGYEEATDIQAGSIPSILEGMDVTGRSSTGTGKTAAFGLPLVQRTAENSDRSSVLILAPTRELALQITDEIRKFSKYLPSISVACIYGGQPMDGQIRALKKARIVVGTPGRVMDHMRRRTLKLDHLKTIVLDEADEMLNMGFIDDIRTILESTPSERQTILFSATLSPEILKITEEFQTETVFVKADRDQKTAAKIEQHFYYVNREQKEDALKLLLEATHPRKCLIFCNTKKMVDELADSLIESGYRAVGLHGDLKQNQRNTVMRDFKNGRSRILIATDVAARGIDVDHVDAVFNFDIPQELEYYVHRIGRTGRAGREGSSHTLVAGRMQLEQLRSIERYIGASITESRIPTREEILKESTQEFRSQLKESLLGGVSQEWLDFIGELTAEGFDPSSVAALLCERIQKKNKRLQNLNDVERRTAPSRSPGKDRRGGDFSRRRAGQGRPGTRPFSASGEDRYGRRGGRFEGSRRAEEKRDAKKRGGYRDGRDSRPQRRSGGFRQTQDGGAKKPYSFQKNPDGTLIL